jgi:phage/plasmid-associated DNA primase
LIQCKSGEEMSESLGELASDVSIFVEEKCKVGPTQEIALQKLFMAWQSWCVMRGIRHPWGSNTFSEKLRAAVPTLTKGRPRKDNPSRATVLFGITLRSREKAVG